MKKFDYIDSCSDCPWFRTKHVKEPFSGQNGYRVFCEHPERIAGYEYDSSTHIVEFQTHYPDSGCPLPDVTAEELGPTPPVPPTPTIVNVDEVSMGATAAFLQLAMDDPECRRKMNDLWKGAQRELKQDIIGDLINHISEIEHAVMTRNVKQWAEQQLKECSPGGVFSSYEDARYDILKEVLAICGQKPAEPEEEEDIPF